MSIVKQQRGMAKAKITRIQTFIEDYPINSEQRPFNNMNQGYHCWILHFQVLTIYTTK